MSSSYYWFVGLFVLLSVNPSLINAQKSAIDSTTYYNQVRTYVNPVLPGDHPDPTLLKVGNDFYHCGSSFHFNPYLPIYHSKDLLHWEIISRVLPPSKAGFVTDKPSAGIWQGAITRFAFWHDAGLAIQHEHPAARHGRAHIAGMNRSTPQHAGNALRKLLYDAALPPDSVPLRTHPLRPIVGAGLQCKAEKNRHGATLDPHR